MRELPPPMMRAPMMMDRKKIMIAAVIALGLLFLMIGAILVDVSRTAPRPGEPADAALARADLANVWGPPGAHFAIFLVVLGLFAAPVSAEGLAGRVLLFLVLCAFGA